MSVFGGLILTNKGMALQAKVQTGTQLIFTKVKLGDGSLGGQSIVELNNLISTKKTLDILGVELFTQGQAKIRSYLTNSDLVSGFYWRELGIFAQDPNQGEILYCYANAGVNAEYIPAGGGEDLLEKYINIIAIIGNTQNVSATLGSEIYATGQDLEAHSTDENIHITSGERDTWNAKETPDGAQAKANAVQSNLNNHTGNGTIHITSAERDAWNAKETPAGAQAKANTVQANLNSHTDNTTIHLNTENVQDIVGALVQAGANINVSYDDANGKITISSVDTNTQRTDEEIRDVIAAFAQAGTNISVTHDDTNNTLTFAVSGKVDDADKVDGKEASGTLSTTEQVNLVTAINELLQSVTTHVANAVHKQVSGVSQEGQYSSAEGVSTNASGYASHAEGNSTTASGEYSHSEGFDTVAVTKAAHVEGSYNLACHGSTYTITNYDNNAKTITLNTVSGLSVDVYLQIKRINDIVLENIRITNISGLVVTLDTTDTIDSSWYYAIKSETYQAPTHAEGNNTVASGNSSHAEGYNSVSSGNFSHAEGHNTVASGNFSHAECSSTKSSGTYSHAEGSNTESSNTSSHAEGSNTVASGYASHTEGDGTTASGWCSHAEGIATTASGDSSHAGGKYNQARYAQTIIGQYGTISSASDTGYSATAEAFMIGNGTGTSSRGLAFKVLFNGQTYADGAYASTGADYAEYFEWQDANPDNEDRVGYFVTLDGEKIRKANSQDTYILGIVSATPSVIGDAQDEHWQGKYLTDEWGRIQYHDVTIPAEYEVIHHDAECEEDGTVIKEAYDEQIEKLPERVEKHPIYNPDWNSEQEYIQRSQRKEWSAIGMVGKLLVRDDGTCEVDSFCKPDDSGIATASNSGYRVMKRVSDNIIQVLVK